MLRSAGRIRVSHAGALPRPERLQRLFDAGPAGEESFQEALPEAVAEVVEQQAEAGVDVVNDGEIGKRGLFIGYIRDRMAGFEERSFAAGAYQPPNAGVTGRDRRDFPGFFAAGLGGFRFGGAGRAHGRDTVTAYFCTGPLAYTGAARVQADVDRLLEAVRGREVEAFLPAVTPGTVEHWLRDEFYPDDESFLFALADVLREEYRAITDAGLILQVDDPDLPDGWQMFPDMTVPEYLDYAALRVAALNHALLGIPEDQVRLHICWGSHHGPHRDDIALRHLTELVFKVPARCYSIEGANPRHEHEWAIWERVRLPEGKLLMPGVVGHATDIIEHPELVAQRLERFAGLVGRENVIAGTDCGLGGRVGHPEIVWAKLAALAEGARLASRRLWRG
ncbi:MAG TPA: cobalamin-independent methionine synthase II family protein [Streptosporangiaceae bacterium]|nr:cobalamin-independent methionine synthase II family protein [Streptosporangiaceae bacterium]